MESQELQELSLSIVFRKKKSQNTLFWTPFYPNLGKKEFSTIFSIYSPLTSSKNLEKTNEPILSKTSNDTHMEELALYWIQYKNSLKHKVGCFWHFSYIYTMN